MKKSLLTIIAALCCTVMAMANAEDFTVDGISYNITSYNPNTVEVTFGDGQYSGDIVIPATVTNDDSGETFSVTSIGEEAFQSCYGITSISIPYSVTSIGQDAFYGCDFVSRIYWDSNVNPFLLTIQCRLNLKELTIGKHVTEIGDKAFEYCNGIESITVLAATPPTVGNGAFTDVEYHTPVYVPNVKAYEGWGGFINIILNLPACKECAKDEIVAAMNNPNVTLSADDKEKVNAYIAQIDNATTAEEVNTAKKAALAIINYKMFRNVKDEAINEINAAMRGETNSAYLNNLIKDELNTLNVATDESTIKIMKREIINKLQLVVEYFIEGKKEGKSESLGTMGTEQDGPAVEVKGKDGSTVKLYNIENVKFSKEETQK